MNPIIPRKQPLKGFCRNEFCHRECLRGGYCKTCIKRVHRLADPEKYYWENLKRSAKSRDIPFDLELEPFRGWLKEQGWKMGEGFSTDRVNDDPRRGYWGYRMDNIQPSTVEENARKWLNWNRAKRRAEPLRFQPLEPIQQEEEDYF